MFKKLFLLVILIFFTSCESSSKRPIVGETPYQIKQNNLFKDGSKSPLKKKDLKNFRGLDFFPVDSSFIVVADLQLTPESPTFKLPRTGGDKVDYRQYGMLNFNLKGKNFEIPVYQSQEEKFDPRYKDYLFLPFTDFTSGNESYGGGRYMNLYISDIKDGKIELNFNNTYNPYCAYNDKYSCPIVPRKNRLEIAITAGVKDFKKQELD